jgi:hypothetical protein
LKPFTTISDAYTALPAGGGVIQVAYGVYSESALLTIAKPLVMYGNNSTLNLASGALVTSNYTGYDLNVVVPTGYLLTYSGAVGTERFILRNGTRKGSMTLSAGTLDTQATTQTWSTTSDVMTISGTGILTEIGCINTLPFVQTGASSVIYIENCAWNTSRNTYLISSTAGQLSVANSVIVNSYASTGGGISIANAATASAPNSMSGVLIAAALSVSLTSGVTIYSKVSVSGTTTLTYAVGVADILGASTFQGDLLPSTANARSIGSATLDLSTVWARAIKGGAAAMTVGNASYATTVTGSTLLIGQGQFQAPSLSQGSALSLVVTTAPNIKATAAFTLTLPAASATYAGMTWQVSSQGNVVTYSGTFKYIAATRNSWTTISASTYASPATALWHTVYCDGTSWLIDVA